MLTFPAVRLATPPNEKRTVMPRRRRNSDLRTREYLTEAEVERLIETALCRARHKAVYAARRTMPNGSATMRCLGEFAGRRAGIFLFHSA
jgi:hypothetical protein